MSTAEATLEKRPSEMPQGIERTVPGKVFLPRVDIVETQDAILIVGDFPGVTEQSMDITLEKNVLTIRGTVASHQPEGHAPLHAEYEIGNFERVFTISDEVERDGIEATVKHGVLRLKLPKSRRAQSQKIPVTAQQGTT